MAICILRCTNTPEPEKYFTLDHGGIIKGDTTKNNIALIFTGGDYNDGGNYIRNLLKNKKITASFFFTGDFYRIRENSVLIKNLLDDGHYLGPHSDSHPLYCTWENRDSLLITKKEFLNDLSDNYEAMNKFGITKKDANIFMPPYEWYNDSITHWSGEYGLILVNYSPGTLSNADYTTPDMSNYRSSSEILQSIVDYERSNPGGLNGFFLLLHIGTHADRTDKFYFLLDELIEYLNTKNYRFAKINEIIRSESIRK